MFDDDLPKQWTKPAVPPHDSQGRHRAYRGDAPEVRTLVSRLELISLRKTPPERILAIMLSHVTAWRVAKYALVLLSIPLLAYLVFFVRAEDLPFWDRFGDFGKKLFLFNALLMALCLVGRALLIRDLPWPCSPFDTWWREWLLIHPKGVLVFKEGIWYGPPWPLPREDFVDILCDQYGNGDWRVRLRVRLDRDPEFFFDGYAAAAGDKYIDVANREDGEWLKNHILSWLSSPSE